MTQGLKWGKITSHADKVVIVASGPSLTGFDFNRLRNHGYYIITINDAVKSTPFADAWFTLDPWGFDGRQLPPEEFTGKLFAAVPEDFGLPTARISDHQVSPPPNITYLHRIVFHSDPNVSEVDYKEWGLNEDTSCINTLNSGYGAFGLAYHMRPKKILLLGLDASRGYFYNNKTVTRSLNHLPHIFESTKPQMEKAGISVINGSVNSLITTYPRYTIDDALARF